jgi:leucyl aminopeptidase (aminopeptidase T)
LGQVDFGHSNARKQATAANVSYFYIPDLMNEELLNLNIQSPDLIHIKERTLALAQMVSEADKARVTSPAGTDLEIDIQGRPGLALQPIYSAPGHFAIVPFYSEVACAPCEGRALGTVVVDGSIVGLSGLNGVVSDPIRWRVVEGRVVEVQGGREASVLAKDLPELGENADCLAELGIGTNFKMRDVLVGNRRDNAIFGHVHLALGRNTDLGGQQWSPIHADFMTRNVKLELDGKPVIDQGRFIS